MFTLGCPNLTLVVDHRPLLGVLNDRSLDSIENPRLLKLKEKTLLFDFKIVHVSGSSDAIRVADAISQHPTGDIEGDQDQEKEDGTARAFAAQQAENVEAIMW